MERITLSQFAEYSTLQTEWDHWRIAQIIEQKIEYYCRFTLGRFSQPILGISSGSLLHFEISMFISSRLMRMTLNRAERILLEFLRRRQQAVYVGNIMLLKVQWTWNLQFSRICLPWLWLTIEFQYHFLCPSGIAFCQMRESCEFYLDLCSANKPRKVSFNRIHSPVLTFNFVRGCFLLIFS